MNAATQIKYSFAHQSPWPCLHNKKLLQDNLSPEPCKRNPNNPNLQP